MEEAARVTGIDPVRLRKNLIPPSAMPFKTPINTYDSGDFPAIVDKALELADFDNFNKRRRESAKRKKLRRIGVSCMLEHAGAMPMETASCPSRAATSSLTRLQRPIDRPRPCNGVSKTARQQAGHRSGKIQHRHGDTALGLTGFASVGSTLSHVRRQRHRAQR